MSLVHFRLGCILVGLILCSKVSAQVTQRKLHFELEHAQYTSRTFRKLAAAETTETAGAGCYGGTCDSSGLKPKVTNQLEDTENKDLWLQVWKVTIWNELLYLQRLRMQQQAGSMQAPASSSRQRSSVGARFPPLFIILSGGGSVHHNSTCNQMLCVHPPFPPLCVEADG
jgi:hypothetical protein